MYISRRNLLRAGLAFPAASILLADSHQEAKAQQQTSGSTVMNILGNFYVGKDALTSWITNVPSERLQLRQTFYVPKTALPNTAPLYRLYQSKLPDHMDSGLAGEAGYTTEGILGYPFKTPVTGSSPLRRFVSPLTGDHLTSSDGDPVASNYRKEGGLGFGFPRYFDKAEVLTRLAGSQITLGGNLVAGGAISELWWGGKQFINAADYGRYLQCAYSEYGKDGPTEAGDAYGSPGVVAGNLAHGSPLVNASTQQNVLYTSCYPLLWQPENWGGGIINPVLCWDQLSKQVEVGFSGRPNLIRWTVQIAFDEALTTLSLELATAYLVSDFNRFYWYRVRSKSCDEVTDIAGPIMPGADPPNAAWINPMGVGGGAAIIATQKGDYAIGFYYPKQLAAFGNQGNSGLGFFNFIGLGDFGGDPKFKPDTTKMSLFLRSDTGINRGNTSWTMFMMAGSLTQVRNEADWLYTNGF